MTIRFTLAHPGEVLAAMGRLRVGNHNGASMSVATGRGRRPRARVAWYPTGDPPAEVDVVVEVRGGTGAGDALRGAGWTVPEGWRAVEESHGRLWMRVPADEAHEVSLARMAGLLRSLEPDAPPRFTATVLR